jgi:hypothetical protein
MIEDEIDGVPLVLYRDGASEALGVWKRSAGEKTLSFARRAQGSLYIDADTGTTWDLVTGEAVQGERKGEFLEGVRFIPTYWFSWRDFYPETTIF